MADRDPSGIVVLKGLEAVRRRPGMFIGDTKQGTGLHQLLWEVLSNAIDEHLRGTATRVSVQIEGDSFTVEDDGRGIPVDPVPRYDNKTPLEIVFTTFHGGRLLGGRPHVHLGPALYGVGLAPVTALSARLEVHVWRDGRIHRADFERGDMLGALRDEGPTTRTGTRVTVTPDFTIFTRRPWDLPLIGERLRVLAAFNPRLTVELQRETFAAPSGLADHVRYLARDQRWLHADPLRVEGQHEDVEVEVALLWTDREDTQVLGFVSQAPTRYGTHLDAFWIGLRRALASVAPARLGKLKTSVLREVMGPGLVAVVHAGMYDAKFGDPCRDRLLNPAAGTAVAELLAPALGAWLRGQPELLDRLLRRLPGE